MRACEKHGREALGAITAEMESKSEEEVRAYAKVFWRRCQELSDWEKVSGFGKTAGLGLARDGVVEKGERGHTEWLVGIASCMFGAWPSTVVAAVECLTLQHVYT